MPSAKHFGMQQIASVMIVNRESYHTAYRVLLDSLSPQYREVYDAVDRAGGACSADIRAACNIKSDSQASTMLKMLERIGLLSRRLVDNPRRYIYEVQK